MDTSCKKNKDVTLDQMAGSSGSAFQSNQHQTSKEISKIHSHPDARSMSPCRILTTASSSGSDPLASPSNEAVSDGDMHTENPLLLAGAKGQSNVSVLSGIPYGIGNPAVQARLTMLEKQFLMQKEILSRQFEEQCRLLDNEQQVKVQEYLKLLGQQQQQHHSTKEDGTSDLKKKAEDDQLLKYKKKRKTDESAVASTAVKLKLRECLLNKNRAEHHQPVTDSPPELRQWSTQHSSLDQHSPPTNTKWSPPLHVLNSFEDEYPLRKTVSEPTLKMKSCKMSLRQRVMQRNNPQLKRREMYRKKNLALVDHDSSPNSPPLFDSHGSSVDESKGPTAMESSSRAQEVAKSVQMADSFGSQVVAVGLQGLKKESVAPGHYGSLPMVGGRSGFPILTQDVVALSGIRNKPSCDSGCGDVASQTSLCSGAVSSQAGMDGMNLTEAYVQALMMARSSLPRTRSEPIPLPVQLLLQQQLLKSHEYLQKEPNKYFFKQVGGKKMMMENVDESVERQISAQEYLAGRSVESEEEVDIIVVDDAAKNQSATGLVYDPSMLKHACTCQSKACHPENPDRLSAIWTHFRECGYIEKCQLIKSRRAMKEELQTCHSEAYVHMYASTNRPRDPAVFETFALRFCQLPCGGIGVDSDTVWNEYYTATAARIAAGCAIEVSHKVATGEIQNGFAVIRPPGHHAEDMQAMGFCYFNSIGIATKQLLDKLRMQRILILDWDVHHGNSTQQLFYADPRVLYISLHRYDNGNFFPGTGDPSECGIDRGEGFNVNIGWSDVPMADAEYLAAFRSIVMPIAREFQPEMVMVSAGFDAARGHPAPLGGYNLSPECFGYMTRQLMTLANQKTVLLLEGGYELIPLAESALACLKALLNEPLSPLSASELCRPPCQQSIKTLLTVLKYQVNYWPCLRPYAESIVWSHLESQQKWSHMNLPFF